MQTSVFISSWIGLNIASRLTHFTRVNYDKYTSGLPFIQKIDQCFKKLIPEAHKKQLCKANEKSHLQIPKTCSGDIIHNFLNKCQNYLQILLCCKYQNFYIENHLLLLF